MSDLLNLPGLSVVDVRDSGTQYTITAEVTVARLNACLRLVDNIRALEGPKAAHAAAVAMGLPGFSGAPQEPELPLSGRSTEASDIAAQFDGLEESARESVRAVFKVFAMRGASAAVAQTATA
jgi:hypothetical protein